MPNSKILSLIELLKESETALINSIEEVTDQQLVTRPSPTEWSIAEIIEHLTMADLGIIKNIKRQEPLSIIPETVDTNLIPKIVVPRKVKVPAPASLVPTGKFKTKTEAIKAFQETRKIVIQFAETTDLPLEKIVWKHFAIGLIDGYGWINFTSRHCQRHILQIEEVKTKL